MRLLHGVLTFAIVVCWTLSAWICYDRGIEIHALIDYIGDVIEHGAEEAGDAVDAVGDGVAHALLHREASPALSGPAILHMIQARSMYRCAEYSSHYTDTLSIHLPKTGLFGWDWINKDGHYSLWGCILGRVPVQINLAELASHDVGIASGEGPATVEIILPEPVLGPCEIDYETSFIRRVTDGGLSNHERADNSFQLANDMMDRASIQLHLGAAASGLIEQTKVEVATDVVNMVQAVYPEAQVTVTFRQIELAPGATGSNARSASRG